MAMALRIGLALLIMLAILWSVWGFKDRPLSPRPIADVKGVYQGPPDQPMDEAAREAARQRAWNQAF